SQYFQERYSPVFTNKILQFRFRVFALLVLAACALRPLDSLAQSQKDVERDRNRGVVMSKLIKDYIKEYYYDPNYHGMDLDARFKAADDRIRKAANISEVLGIIAQAMVELNDSHTFFIPPS